MTSPGKFISLEGIEGAGKSTHVLALANMLESRGISCICTRETGGTAVGERILQVLLDESLRPMQIEAELLLHFAARADHVATLIRPALAQGTWVISDRFVDSSFAYQGAGMELGEARIEVLAQWTLGDFAPDRVIILDVDEQTGFERIQDRGHLDWYEKLPIAFFSRARQCYLDRAAARPQQYRVIDATREASEVRQEVQAVALELIK